jgi:hypothetical protein
VNKLRKLRNYCICVADLLSILTVIILRTAVRYLVERGGDVKTMTLPSERSYLARDGSEIREFSQWLGDIQLGIYEGP